MPIIILLTAFAVYGAANIYTNNSKNTKIYTKEELDKMLGVMVGKSKRKARKIVQKYRK